MIKSMARKGTTKYKSNKQEKDVAKILGGKTVMASGSLWQAKGDVRTSRYLVECKTTDKDFYKLEQKILAKIAKEAIKDGLRSPLLVFDCKNERFVAFRIKDCSLKASLIFKLFKVNVIDTLVKGRSISLSYKEDLKSLNKNENAIGFSVHNYRLVPETWFLVSEEVFLKNERVLYEVM